MCLSIKVLEPFRVLAEGTHAGFEWIVVRNDYACRCGYVRLPKGHPWHGKPYDDIGADVHGGLTFAEPDLEYDAPGEDDAWWIGFDCGHASDAPDPSLPGLSMRWSLSGVVRSQSYAEAECRALCEQAAEVIV